jgi:2-isopropylmalate synthase
MSSESSDRVRIFDTTLRDGEQSAGVSLNPAEKLQIAHALARLRVDVIEAGFPVASPGDFDAVRAIAREVRGSAIAALARTRPADIETAGAAVREAESPRIHTFIATSPVHMEFKLRMTPEEVLEQVRSGVSLARSLVEDVEFSAEDASRSEPEFLAEVFRTAVRCGATTLNVPDTVGYATPEEYSSFLSELIRAVAPGPDVVWSVHCHDDLGLAVANSLAAVAVGVRQVECTINGLGERAGNAAMEEIVMALRTRADRFGGATTRIDATRLWAVSRLVARASGISVPPNKAVVGDNAFAHESGIHQHGVLRRRETYEIIRPEDVGSPGTRLVLGKHSGRHALRDRLITLGFDLDEERLDRAFDIFKRLADRKKHVSDGDLEALVADEILYEERNGHAHPTGRYALVSYSAAASGMGGAEGEPGGRAAVTLSRNGETLSYEAEGNGPVDAAYMAVRALTGVEAELVSYRVEATSESSDAVGESTVVLKDSEGDRKATGRGMSTDVIEASIKAYVAATNRILAHRAAASAEPGGAAEAEGSAKR